MTKVFVSGSRSVRTLPAAAKTSLDKIMELGFIVFVGDCHGVDTLVQDYLAAKDYRRVVVFHIGEESRNNRGFDTVRVSGSRQTDKDAAMSKGAEYGLAIVRHESRNNRAKTDLDEESPQRATFLSEFNFRASVRLRPHPHVLRE